MLDLWVFNIIFIFIFMKYFLHKETYKHQLISLIVIFSINFNEGSDYDTVKNIYGSYLYVVLFYFIFLILSALLCSSQVLEKKIMEICYVSPFTILFVIGIFSGLFAFITLIITTNVSCNESLTKNKLCSVSNDDYNKGSFYFDNFSIFLINLGDQFNNNKAYFFIEIFLVYPIYAFVCFAKYFYETLVVLNLNPYYVLLSDNIFYSVRKIVTLIYNNKDTQTYLKLCGELIAIIGYCFYLEIFILGCCGLNAIPLRHAPTAVTLSCAGCRHGCAGAEADYRVAQRYGRAHHGGDGEGRRHCSQDRPAWSCDGARTVRQHLVQSCGVCSRVPSPLGTYRPYVPLSA